MTEPEILEAYRDLSTPTSPPADLLSTVERRIRRRRTARRAVLGAAALAVAGSLVGVATLGGSDADKGAPIATDNGPRPTTSTLTYTDTDGSTYTFAAEDLEVTCPEPQPGGRQHLVLARPDGALPVLYVDLHVDEVEPGQVFDLPYDVDGGTDELPMIFFFTTSEDDAPGAPEANELGSNQEGSSGRITLHEASCGVTPSLWIEIDGTLGSEVGMPALPITGEYRS